MKRFLTSGYSPLIILAVGLIVGVALIPDNLQKVAAAVGMAGLALGMTKQAWMQYKNGKVGVHWTLNTLMFLAITLRGIYMVRTGQYWLAIPDVYGSLVIGAIQFQLAVYLLKKQEPA